MEIPNEHFDKENVDPDHDGSDMSDNEISAMVDETVPAATKRSTAWGMKVFKHWQERRHLDIDLHTVSPEVLSAHLKKFYAEVKKRNGELYTPSALVGIRAALHRTLISPPFMRNVNILDGSDFIAANRVFTAKCKIYTARGNPKPKHKPCIADKDMKKLGEYFASHRQDPRKLSEYVWFGLCYYFGRRGREGWRDLTPDSFTIEKDEYGVEYITDGVTMTTKNHQGGAKVDDNDYSDARLYNNEFVEAFRLFLARRNPKEKALFQTPKPCIQPDDEVWYKAEPMGKNFLGKIMQGLSSRAKLSQIYTPHCVRASMITILFQAGVQPKEICAITKHKREASLDPYIRGTSSAQKQQCSTILSSALGRKVNIIHSNRSIVYIFFKCLLNIT